MKKNLILIWLVCFFMTSTLWSQTTFPTNGAPNNTKTIYAFTHGTIITNPTDTILGTMLIQGEQIIAIGAEVMIPAEAIIIDAKDKFIYPSFIDPCTSYGIPKEEKQKHHQGSPQYDSNKKGAYGWNEHIQPELNASEVFFISKKSAKRWINIGFGAVGSHITEGLMTGTGLATTLADKSENNSIIAFHTNTFLSFDRSNSKQSYPRSLMGKIALIRQTYYDAEWYASGEREEKNLSLEAIKNNIDLNPIFNCHNKYDILRADKIGDEFGIQYTFRGNGDEYQRIEDIKNTNGKIIIPLEFPKAYETDDYYKSLDLSLKDMQHWYWAPRNPGIIESQSIDFAFTLGEIKESETFLVNLRKAIKLGLTKQQALQSLTQTPAEILNIHDKVGSLEKGKIANFIICSGDIFENDTKIHQNWVQGKVHKLSPLTEDNISGKFSLKINSQSYHLEIFKTKKGYNAKLAEERTTIDTASYVKVKLSKVNKRVNLQFQFADQIFQLSGVINDRNNLWSGNGKMDAMDIQWHAIKKEDNKKKEKPTTDMASVNDTIQPFAIEYPLGGYGWDSLPQQETVLFRRARIWTNEEEGILEDHDLLIHQGKIFAIGRNIKVPDLLGINVEYRTIIAKNMDITAGLIDEHSHIAIERGVNEGGQASSAEVRIGDVITADDINIYRQLAGGVTTSQLLHGSANPIGGQSAIIKLRWGMSPEAMKFEGADPTIKFALGENVKQSNWGDNNTTRFPQTRMGVEQVYYDHFLRAKQYSDAWSNHNSPKDIDLSKRRKKKNMALAPMKKEVLRRDLELDALSEILEKKRFITCHSYSQSEINMLMNVADSMGFTVNTFTHILEGYKLADKLKEHGANASTFSDWWAYKFEVNDAIPYNAALMLQRGINVGINSDDAEMGRRLNQEAAKTVKYGGIGEIEALKMVTLNPAKMLHIDDKVGSIKVGKDADIVLWSGNPLSVYSHVEYTYIDGIPYYDIARDEKMKDNIQKQRALLIKEMMNLKKDGAKTQKIKPEIKKNYHCDDLEF